MENDKLNFLKKKEMFYAIGYKYGNFLNNISIFFYVSDCQTGKQKIS